MRARLVLLSTACALSELCAAAASAQEGDTPLEEIVVTATKRATPFFETPVSAEVISGDAVERNHLENLSDVVQRLPNVYFSNLTHSNPSITIRGLGSSDDESDSISSSVLIDGVPVYGMALGGLFDLRQIEVLRGPQSTLYRQDSMGGIVALRTRDPGFAWRGDIQADYGSGDRRRLTVTPTSRLGAAARSAWPSGTRRPTATSTTSPWIATTPAAGRAP